MMKQIGRPRSLSATVVIDDVSVISTTSSASTIKASAPPATDVTVDDVDDVSAFSDVHNSLTAALDNVIGSTSYEKGDLITVS